LRDELEGINNMPTVERKPLPPLGSKPIAAITEADRADIMARANDVIDYYLNGPASYFDAGTRKPLAGDRDESTVRDLQAFKDHVLTAMQSADDPGKILRSVADLIDGTIEKVNEAEQNSYGQDHILRQLPQTNDRIELPRQKGNPVPDFFPSESQSVRPIAEKRSEPNLATTVRILTRRITSRSPASRGPIQAASNGSDSFDETSIGGGISPRDPNLPAPPPQEGRPLGIVSGQPMPDWITPPPIFGYRDRPRAAVDEGREWLMRMVRSVGN
jgi:hypothetical protein